MPPWACGARTRGWAWVLGPKLPLRLKQLASSIALGFEASLEPGLKKNSALFKSGPERFPC